MIEELFQNTYLIAINRFQNMILLGISNRPLSLRGQNAEEEWKIDYDCHINCIWRIKQGGKIISGYQDVYTEIDENGEIIEEDEEETSDRDAFVRKRTLFEKTIFGKIYPDLPLKILDFARNEVGDLKIVLEKEYCFEAFTTFPEEADQEEWYLMNKLTGVNYSYPEDNVEEILLIDETNTELSQILELILQEIVDENIIVSSAGIHPGTKVEDRVLKLGKNYSDFSGVC